MDEYVFDDALANSTVTCTYPGLQTAKAAHINDNVPCESLFFPGCSFINYALPLVQSVYDLLKGAGVDMSTPAPVENAMKVFEGILSEMEKLAE